MKKNVVELLIVLSIVTIVSMVSEGSEAMSSMEIATYAGGAWVCNGGDCDYAVGFTCAVPAEGAYARCHADANPEINTLDCADAGWRCMPTGPNVMHQTCS